MDEDFSTPQAIAVLFDLSRDVNTLLSEKRAEPEAIVDAEYLFSSLGGDVSRDYSEVTGSISKRTSNKKYNGSSG